MVNGYAILERQSWDNFHEGVTLIENLEAYKRRFGFYPKAVLVDQIYRTRENRAFCKGNGIRLSGPALGRPTQAMRRQNNGESLDKMRANATPSKANLARASASMGLAVFGHAFKRRAKPSLRCNSW
jgi:hypothetical protein